MWANAANREVINFFIDAAKAVVNLANAIGVVPTSLALLMPYVEIITRARSGHGIITSLLEWAANLSDMKNLIDDVGQGVSNVASPVEQVADMIADSTKKVQESREIYLDAMEDMMTPVEGTVSITPKLDEDFDRASMELDGLWDEMLQDVDSSANIAANEAEAASARDMGKAYEEAAVAEAAESAVDKENAASSAMVGVANEGETATVNEQTISYATDATAEMTESEVDMANAASSAAAAGSQAMENVSAGAGGATKSVSLLSKAFNGLLSTIGPVGIAIAAVGTAAFAAWKIYNGFRESWFNDAKTATDTITQQQQSFSSQIENYQKLKEQLDSGNLSEQETINTKQQILDIQKTIIDEYGEAAQGVDLINGKLEKQVDLLNNISQNEYQKTYDQNREGYEVALEEYNKERNFGFMLTAPTKEIQNALTKSGFDVVGAGSGTFMANVKADATEGLKTLEKARDSLNELKKQYKGTDTEKIIEANIKGIDKQISKAYESIDKYEKTALKGLELKLALDNKTGYDIYNEYQSSVSDLESAYMSGDNKKIQESRKAFEEATKAKNDFLKVGSNGQFSLLFDNINTGFVDIKNRYYDTVELLKQIPQPEQQEGLFESEKDKKKVYQDNSKALDKLSNKELKAYKAAEKLYKLNPDRVDIEGTLLDNTYASGKYSDALNNLMNQLGWSTDNTDMLIDALIDAGIVQGSAADIANYASESYSNFSSSIDEAITNINTLNTVMTESASGKGITEQNLDLFKKAFGDDGLSVLEKTANGYHLNAEGARLLREQQDALVKSDYATALSEQYTALQKLQDGYNAAKDAGEDVSGYIQQRDAIQANIDKLNEELMAYNNANSAYQTWLAKQNSEGEREMYNSIYSGYDAVKDELDRGFAGEKSRSWLDLVFNDENEDWDAWTAPVETINEKFKEVTKDIEGTGGYSIADFFTVDANGKSTSQGIWNFFEAIENKQDEVGKKFVDLEEGIFDFGENGDYQIADLFGMDVESVQAILRAAADAGFEVHLDQPLYSMEKLEEKAESAKTSLEELTGKKMTVDLDPSSVEEADESMQKLTTYQQSLMEDNTIEPNVKTKMLQDCASLMELIAAKKRELVEGQLYDFNLFDTKQLQESKENINDIVNRLSSYSKDSGKTEFSEQFSIDPMLLNNVDYLQDKIDTLKEIRPNVDDTQVEYLDQLLMQLQQRIELLNGTNINDKNITVDQFMAADKIVGDINAKLDYANQHSDITFDWDSDEEFVENLNTLANLPEDVKVELGIPVDKTGEELLELAKKGELHIGIKTDGEVPKSGEVKGTTTTNTVVNEQDNIIRTTIEADNRASIPIEEANQGLTNLENKKTVTPIDADTKDFKQKTTEAKAEKKEVGKDVITKFKGDNSDVVNKANSAFSAANFLNTTITTIFKSSGLGDLKGDIQDAINKVNHLDSRISTVSNRRISGTVERNVNGTAHVNGTAFIRGTAFAGGKWGLSKNQQALVGELGTELLVRDGQWQTIGDNGAEFVNLKRGDIIFNHKQAQELLENGYVTSNKGRGHLVGFANGSAYSHGTSSGAIKPTTSSKNMAGSTTKGSSSSRGSSNNGSSNRGNNNNNNNNNTNKEAKETKNTLDEVEILIARIERQITNLDKIIGSTYKTWATRNKKIKTQLGRVAKEITAQNKAYTTYIKKANSVGLPSEWKKKIQSGKYRIEDVKDEKLWEKISQYKEYYEKALAARDAVLDLKEKEGELYKQRFDNSQSYYEQTVEYTQNIIDLNASRNDTLSEAGKLNSVKLYAKQLSNEKTNLKKLQKEYKVLIQRRDEAVKSGKIKKGSEAWYEMELAIQQVSNSIEETNKNIITLGNNIRQVSWDRWDRIHDAIGSVTEEMEFLYDLMDEDKMFNDKGEITNQGITGFALLAQQYDTYFSQVQEYQKEINKVQKQLAKDPYNQDLVDKLKELKAAQQDAAANAKKTKDSMVDLTEKGIKKQIDYIKKLIDDYEELLETQKDQIDYAKKVFDQQKEINKLEKQYRAIQNDDSEEGATKRQQLREQLQEKRDALKETQEDRRLSETKDILSKFETSFEDFLNKKLDNVEGIVREVINTTNENRNVIRDTINSVAASYGYTPSDTLKSAIDKMSTDLVSYFNGGFENSKVNTIAEGVNAIVEYYRKAQENSEGTTTKKPTTKKPTTKKPTTKKPTTTTTKKEAQDKANYARNQLKVAQDNLAATKKSGNKNAITLAEKELKEAQKAYNNAITAEGKVVNSVKTATVKGNVVNINTPTKSTTKTTKATVSGSSVSSGSKLVDNFATNKTVSSGSKLVDNFATGKVVSTPSTKHVSEWVTSGGKKYYYKADGTKATGITYIAGKYYSFDKNGVLQNKTEAQVRAELIKSAGTHMLKYKDANGNTLTGYYKDNGTLDAKHTGWAKKGNKIYRFENGKLVTNKWITVDGKKYYIDSTGARVTGKQTINSAKYTFDNNGVYKKKGWKKGTASIPKTDLAWTNEGRKPEAIIRKSDGAILTPLSKGDSVIPNSAMKNMYKALVDPEKYLKQYTIPDIKIVQSKENGSSSPATINMQFIANGVQDANKFANDLMNNKKIEKWIQEITLGQANGNNSYRKYSYTIR